MHDSNVAEVEIGNSWSWHRDNPCRRTGYGPDGKNLALMMFYNYNIFI